MIYLYGIVVPHALKFESKALQGNIYIYRRK
jgi:hypothetical protein